MKEYFDVIIPLGFNCTPTNSIREAKLRSASYPFDWNYTSMEKINKYSPGMHIPIVSMNKFKNNKYDFTYLFAWNHKKEIFQKEKEYIKRGGKWLSHVKI